MSGSSAPSEESGSGPKADPVEAILDAVLYAPLGFAVSARELWPGLVETGRREAGSQLRTAHLVGRFVVQMARSQGPTLLRQLFAQPSPPAPESAEPGPGPDPGSAARPEVVPAAPAARRRTAPPRRPGPRAASAPRRRAADPGASGSSSPPIAPASSGSLAIEGYDTLPASLIVPRLSGLGPAELEAIRAHEASTRRRRTILSRVAQLESERGGGVT